jgi:hypothetical protein
MAAFVAVADDASAVAWNPSGLVSGPIFNVQVDLAQSSREPSEAPAAGDRAGRMSGTLISIGTTPLGLAYYRLTSTSFVDAGPAAVESRDRQHRRVLVRTLVTNHLGATVQQSVGEYLTLGATVKLVRGSVGVAATEVASWDEASDRSDALEREGSTRGDVDVGAMFAAGRMRAGVVVRNVTAPAFGVEGTVERVRLDRHVRIGAAWADRWPGISRTVVSVDADLTDVPHPAGERRDIAAGLEHWARGHRVGIRGGLRASVVGEARPVVSGGGSFAVRPGMYVDGFVAFGNGGERRWGVAARFTY